MTKPQWTSTNINTNEVIYSLTVWVTRSIQYLATVRKLSIDRQGYNGKHWSLVVTSSIPVEIPPRFYHLNSHYTTPTCEDAMLHAEIVIREHLTKHKKSLSRLIARDVVNDVIAALYEVSGKKEPVSSALDDLPF